MSVADFIKDILKAIDGLFSSKPAAAPVQSCPIALTPKQAQEWFDKFKNDTSIPWNYPNDCCYARAEAMARKLKAAGVPVGKEWNYAPDAVGGGPLMVPTPNDPKGYVTWGYHVAPTVPVSQPDGSIKNMVIDPSISEHPLTPEEWKALQNQPDSDLVHTSSDPFYRSPDGRVSKSPSDDEIADIFDDHRRERAKNWAP